MNDYFDRHITIVETTHQMEEVEHDLTDVMFIDRGRIVFECSMDELESRYLEVMVHPDQVAAARALKPMHERQTLGRSILLFDCGANRNGVNQQNGVNQNIDRQQFTALGD